MRPPINVVQHIEDDFARITRTVRAFFEVRPTEVTDAVSADLKKLLKSWEKNGTVQYAEEIRRKLEQGQDC